MILRALTLGLCLAGLSACSESKGLLARGVAVAVDDDSVVPKTSQGFPPRFAALVEDTSIPALLLTVENRKQTGRMLREARVNGVDTWLSSDLTALMLEDGMLQGTRGLGSELFAADVSEPKAMILSGRGGYSDRLHSNLTGTDEISTRAYRCLVETQGSATLALEIGAVATRKVTEDCKSLDQSFRNTYWVSVNSGAIVQARQWAGDEVGYLMTKAAAR
ncbi:hypothetical protein LCGC14_0489040 [marine sediment metagenome]|uniref:Uncharacterized protein n=2 Tax=root TaxID=1 RepID=A0A7V1EZF0_9RHOB|nr:YjbF family lipoprotein [Sulfitobacter litoralis]HDY94093.1 hypothetical protein [Sulfitobacter litoralis]HDZ51953.1 hypothetical protein [Sulfitobacter litoralis]|tara:strand:- start:2245 stop:2904 length:660 start_codon:yes stop_codon:yes gene_type:complete